ncbi:DUF6436 domain-containing protein [Pseudomonas sp. App30]|uniref:DUF6436 domain-containing protein n=1 Tax=Pseudomonas sp. App30 TaxID=3068990 RepID=UPI003A80D18E
MPASRRKTLFLTLLALICGLTLWTAYDWFQGRYIRVFSEHATLFEGDALKLPDALAGPGPIRLVHFWDPACPCNVVNEQHLAELTEQFAAKGVRFYSVQRQSSRGNLPRSLGITSLPDLPGSDRISASPAVAIWDRAGKLAYFGPYSEGAVCSSSNSFIEPILKALDTGLTVQATHMFAVGCYCPWQQ